MLAIYSLTTFLSVPILRKISVYKEKILLLVSRLNLSECEFELTRLNTCLKSLTSDSEAWIVEDFVSIITLSARVKLKKLNAGGMPEESSSVTARDSKGG